MNLICESEERLNALLPTKRLVTHAPGELLTAAREWSDKVWAEAVATPPVTLLFDDINKGLALMQNPVFICGVHRSGTTLVRDLLDGHQELAVLPSEGTFYTNLEAKLLSLPEEEQTAFLGKEWLRRLANPVNQAPYWLLGRSTEDTSPYVDFARYLMAWWKVPELNPQTAVILAYASFTGKLGAKHWVDKTPTNECFLKRIWQDMPNAKIIHVVREPVATLASRKKMEPGITLKRALSDLQFSLKVAVEQLALKDERFLLVKYEDLCDDAEGFKKQIATFLDIAPSDTLSKPTVAGMASKANSSFDSAVGAGLILKTNAHRQSEVLSDVDKQYIAGEIGKLAGRLGYQLAPVNPVRRWLLRLRYLALR